MKVYHGYYDDRVLIGEANTQEEVNKIISDYIKKINFTCYYIRQWMDKDGTLVVDYGSHTQFFFVEGVK